ncbi:hypothetical protein N0V90_013346 [Kalmusia sp. IMI 367209]|nr:hypothetical protein N0V90_013346 [Kalmusia sp. IMI 367209]
MAGQQGTKAAEWLVYSTVSPFDQTTTSASFNTSTKAGLKAWIYWHYLQSAFCPDGTFKGFAWFREHVSSLDTVRSKEEIDAAIHSYIREKAKADVQAVLPKLPLREHDTEPSSSISSDSFHTTIPVEATRPLSLAYEVADTVTGKLGPVCLSEQLHEDSSSDSDNQDEDPVEKTSQSVSGEFGDTDFLLSSNSEDGGENFMQASEKVASVQHAPLIDADVISSDTQHLLPQYGLLGWHVEARDTESKLFLNTNVPLSVFLCGVQGSGKSHTTYCILENTLVPCQYLGKLQSPLSALVFNYGQFSGDGAGFNLSEAAFLTSPNPELPGGAHVKRVHVLVSPSNFVRISKLYLKLPNVSVTPFKLNPQNLDIETMLTLMNVSESNVKPLYMAQVRQILREMSTAGGSFNYEAFKQHLNEKEFTSAQASMLKMRLDLLESFLDLDNSCFEPQFRPGEITIMDMSCPFVDANTACILFRIGLMRYLQSEGTSKLIVLDEAHKYMLKVPGAKALNETLLDTIRLQRHYGARVVISTQEPTLLTDLIALCSVTIIHRFSSPKWLSAIKRHIPTTEDGDSLMRRIESLRTGTAMVYSPNAVLGHDGNDNWITGMSKMINVNIRKRITSDGGQSVLAV